MDTRDQTLTKLTQSHGKSYPTHHRPGSLRWNYSHTVMSIMKLVMEDGWSWWWRWIPLSGAQNGLQIYPPEEEQEVATASYRKTRWILLFDFFLPEREYMELELRSVEVQEALEIGGAPRRRGRVPLSRGQALGPLMYFFRPVFFINSKKCLRWFPGHSENFSFLHIRQHHGSSAENKASLG